MVEQASFEENSADFTPGSSIQPYFILVDKYTNQEFEPFSYQPMLERPVGDSSKPLKSEKEFEKEVAEIAVKLKDTQTCDWKLRTAALKRIQYFA